MKRIPAFLNIKNLTEQEYRDGLAEANRERRLMEQMREHQRKLEEDDEKGRALEDLIERIEKTKKKVKKNLDSESVDEDHDSD